MKFTKGNLPSGLYLVATPIGNARDITLRALDILASADVLAAEDTRSLRRLMEIHGVALGDRPIVSYHDHNGAKVRPRLLRDLEAGKSIAYASEAGTPMIADPGFDLARAVTEEGHMVTSAPGATAFATALTLAGLPTDKALFAGFLPNTSAARCAAMQELSEVPATLAFYESPKRLPAMLADAAKTLGPRPAAVCRELTMKFEECRRGRLPELAEFYANNSVKGEIVVVIDRGGKAEINESDVTKALEEAMTRMSVRDAVDMVSNALGVKRRTVYQMAMKLGRDT